MSAVITLLLFVITSLVGVMAYFGKKFIEWAKVRIDEHIKGENEFRVYVKEEIKKINDGMDVFLKDLNPILNNVEKIPEIEKKVDAIELDIKHIKKYVKYEG